MSSYAEKYFYPGTGTLINHFKIRDPATLEKVEADLTTAVMRQLPDVNLQTVEGLQSLHHHIFGQIYPWAGEFRSVDMERVIEDGPNVTFAPGFLVNREMGRLCGELRHDTHPDAGWDGLSRKEIAFRSAVYMADLNQTHPFPEGNGRVQRLVLGDMVERAGFALQYEAIGPKDWISASKDSYGQFRYDAKGQIAELGQHEQMTVLIEQSIEPWDPSLEKAEALALSIYEEISKETEANEGPELENNQERDHDIADDDL